MAIVVYCLLLVSLTTLFSVNILVDNAKADWWNSSYDYMKQITINHDYVDNDLVNFPVLVTSSNTTMLSKMDDGNSLRFTNLANDTEYNYEIEYFDDTDEMVVWVNLTSISSTVDTVFNMYYNNSGASDGQDVAGTWNSGYLMVEHLDETSGTHYDSTSNDKDSVYVGTHQDFAGVLDGADEFDGVGDNVQWGTDVDFQVDDFTIHLWYKADVIDLYYAVFCNQFQLQGNFPYGEAGFGIRKNSNNKLLYICTINGAFETGETTDTFGTGWFHYVFVKDGTTVYVYHNGTSVGLSDNTLSSSTVDYTPQYGGTIKTMIGETWREATGIYDLDGKCDEVRFSTVVRNSSWVEVCFHSQNQTTGFLTFGDEQNVPAGATVPVVTTNDATGVEEINATICGTLTNNGSADTTCWFRYGDETPPTDNNASQGVIAHQAAFSYNWQSLTPGTLYYFDTQANNSAGWDTKGGIKSFLTKPNTPTGASCSAGEGYINISWTAATGADRYLVRYKSGSAPTSITDGTLFDNVTVLYINKSIGAGAYYFSIWSYAYESSPTLHHYSDSYDTASGTELNVPTWYSSSFGGSVTVDQSITYTWHSASFGGSVTVGPLIYVELNDSSWIAGSLDCGDDVQKNFTFYQNGSATIDITIGINSTNGNYSFVNYTTWSSNGHDQYCANFTVNTWSSESMIEPGYPASSILKSSFAPGNFAYGIRLWMPKSVTYQDRQEDFEVVLYVSEST